MTIQPPNPGEVETSALDDAAQAIEEGRERVEQQRDKALEQAETRAQANAINSRFDAMQSQLDGLAEQVRTGTAESVQAAVGPLSDQLRELSERLNQTTGSGGEGAIPDDDILSIEEIADDIGEAAGAVGEGVADAAGQVADAVDQAPARGHMLFRKIWGS